MENLPLLQTTIENQIEEELLSSFEPKRKRIFKKFFGAALGSIPWVGGFLSAAVDFKSDEDQVKSNSLYMQWLQEHSKKMNELGETLSNVAIRLNEFPEEIDERLESDEYLQVVRKAFRTWNDADTFEKKELIRKLITNAGTNKLVPDDLIRLFLDWMHIYHEVHFSVIKSVFENPGITRYQMWNELNGSNVREDSLEADLFKMIIRDLSMGGVIRQHRATDYHGNFIKKATRKPVSSTYKSAFDSQEQYELTELGKQFVHYTMNEVVPRVS
jgi:regulator of replication initiation timing